MPLPWMGSTPWSDWGQAGRGQGPGGGAQGVLAPGFVLNFLKNTLFGFLLFLEGYIKREPYRKVSQPGAPPRGVGRCSCLLASPLAICPPVRLSRQSPYLEKEVMKLFSTQSTMKALWQLAAFCPSSLPASSDEA